MELTNIMSIASAMEQCVFKISCGTGSIPVRMCCPGRDTVFPFRAPRLGPNMSSTVMTSPLVIKHPFRCVTATSISSLDLGLMMMFWNLLASCARQMARCVYLSALSVTAVTKDHIFPTFESILQWYNPFEVGVMRTMLPSVLCKIMALLILESMVIRKILGDIVQ